jgi:hypothetical protein
VALALWQQLAHQPGGEQALLDRVGQRPEVVELGRGESIFWPGK